MSPPRWNHAGRLRTRSRLWRSGSSFRSDGQRPPLERRQHLHADLCARYTDEAKDREDFDAAYAAEAAARVAALLGAPDAATLRAKAARLGAAIADREDRELFDGDFAAPPWDR